MIPPFLVVSRTGVQVVQRESGLPSSAQAKFVERRKHRPLWYACNGGIVGASMAFVASLSAQQGTLLNEWTQPSTVIAIIGMIFAGGQMWNARMEDRRRIQKLEDTSVTKEAFRTLAESANRIEAKLDQFIQREHA